MTTNTETPVIYANKIELRGKILLDLTQDTVTEADVAEGKTFHKADGSPAVGTAVAVGKPVPVATSAEMDSILENATDADIGSFHLYEGETTDVYTNGVVYSIQKEDS